MPKKRSLASAVLVCLWVGIYGASPVNAQQPDIKAIQELLESGNHAAAFAEAQKLEATAKAQFGINHPSYAFAISILASFYVEQGKFDEAEGLLRRAIAIYENVLGDVDPVVAHNLTVLATVYSMQRKFAEAEGLLRRALEIQIRALGDSDFSVGSTLNLLALACQAQGKHEEAEALHERGMSIIRNVGRKQ